MKTLDFMEKLPEGQTQMQHLNYADESHLNFSFSILNQMRHKGILCDVTLVARIPIGRGSEVMKLNSSSSEATLANDLQHIAAHKVILAAASPYFNAMFTNDWPEKQQGKIELKELDACALASLVEYAYTGSIIINESNVQTILPAASLLQINSVRDACCKFLQTQLHPSNCLGIRTFADAHSCQELQVISNQYTLENFPQVALTEEFLTVKIEDLKSLVSSDNLNVTSEECVYQAVMRWIKHDMANRNQYLGQLLQHVRLPLTTRSFLLNSVSEEPLIQSCQLGKDLLIEAMKYHLSPESRVNMDSNVRTKERKPAGLNSYVFAVGGGSLFAIHSECEFYNPLADKWTPFAPTLQRRSRLGVVAMNRFLYAIGGYNGTKDLSSGEYYDPYTNQWCQMSSCMNSRRSCLGITTLNGLIYVCGGFDGASSLSSVERYDPLVETWTSVAAMTTPRRYCRLTSLDGCLYSLGGYDGTNYHASIERYDPREGMWTQLPSMSVRRSNCGIAVSNGIIYAAGGNDGSVCLNTVEKFDLRKNLWTSTTPMITRRSTHELVAIGSDFLYSIGGNDSSSSLNSVEKFHVASEKWLMVSSMSLRRSSVGAASIECPDLEALFGRNSPSDLVTADTHSLKYHSRESSTGSSEMSKSLVTGSNGKGFNAAISSPMSKSVHASGDFSV